MNACIRAVVRSACYHNIEVIGFKRGYEGIIDNDYQVMTTESVSGIIQRGGTILKTARSARFMTEAGLQTAAENLKKLQLDGLVLIGGDGTFKGALALQEKIAIPTIGCPGTIDNDLFGTDTTIGFDTAINTVVEAIDKIRDTAESHNRVFIIEVMGRDAGLIALNSAIAGGAEALLVPEINNDFDRLFAKMKQWRSSKNSRIIIVAEGDESGGADEVAKKIKVAFPEFDLRVSILGHIQRGGSPTCMERVNASLCGYHAVKALLAGKTCEMVGLLNGSINFTPFSKAVKHHQSLNPDLEELIQILSA